MPTINPTINSEQALNQNLKFKFEVLYQSKKSRARVGRIHTPHGIIDTPNFVAVGTNGTLKALSNVEVSKLNLQLMFCNTYHLLLQPGPKIVEQAGGLHNFINRKLPIITDSGGFQVFSLAYGGVADEIKSRGQKSNDGTVLKITEEGVLFRSYRDGQKIFLTPESSIQTQKALNADIIIPLDELPPYHMDPKALKQSVDRTHRWEKRSLAEHLKDPKQQAIYAVIHGGVCPDMRKFSCQELTKEAFNGFAIGGSLGKTKQQVVETVKVTTPHIPIDAPIHLLGIGDLPSIDNTLEFGIDTYDSAYPTRAARHGVLLTAKGNLKIDRRAHKDEYIPVEPNCPCHLCENYSRAYLHHLFKAKEPTAHTLASIHNVSFMVRYMEFVRMKILAGLI